ncbi:MAG: DNA polymerase III subunit epsilon [Candidatus Desulforudis sp.]|nr:DNA polymerase III subunit epsilon [Desulforudis sp.]
MSGTYVVLDLETTGLNPKSDEIIEVGMVRLENRRIGTVFHTLVRPSRPLSPRITSLTGLDDAQLADQPEWPEVRAGVLAFLGDKPVVGHHVDFDLAFLGRYAGYRAPCAYDTADLARLVLPGLPSYRLQALCDRLGLPCRPAHRALEDARAAAALFDALCRRFRGLEMTVQAAVHRVLSQTAGSPWFPLIDGLIRAGDAGFLLDDKPVSAGEIWPEISGEQAAGVQCGPEAVEAVLGRGGRLSGYLPNFECREQQLQMARAVTGALSATECLLVEAGTGTGKSFAYLVPAALWAVAGDERVVVSTHTVNLQDQLIEKDIPLLRNALGQPLKAVLLKGRGNYLCRRRWNAVMNEGGFGLDEGFLYARIAVWLFWTVGGDRAELNLRPEERSYWDGVAAGNWGCAGGKCPHHGACFLQQARRAAEQAHLVITNHALLLSDLRLENRLLPAYGALVIDEAHHLEDVATEQLGTRLTAGGVARWIDGVNRVTGSVGEFYPDDRNELLRDGDELVAAARRFFALVRSRIHEMQGLEDDYPAVRLLPGAGNLDETPELSGRYQELSIRLAAYLQRLKRAHEQLTGGSAPAIREDLLAGLELETAVGSGFASDLEFVYEAADPEHVFWAEGGGRRTGDAVLCATPVHVGKALYEGLFRSGKPVILTSATLAVDGSFDFFAERTGLSRLPREQRQALIVGSPFAYDEQALLYVVNDLPRPGDSEGVHLEGVVQALARIAEITRGRTLALFTAHKALQSAYRKLKPIYEGQGIEILGHGVDGGRARLLQRFRTMPGTVLLGASSFWEGVDVPGEALTCLVIVKLPFQPPNRPVFQARREEIRKQGRNDFAHMSLPQAVIRLKQGFGRLIRTTTDRGVVIILDNRLVEKRYGAVFLRSLPVAPRCGSLNDVLAALGEFTGKNGPARL